MEQLQPGMDAVPNAFIPPERGGDKNLSLEYEDSLINNIIVGARVGKISVNDEQPHIGQGPVHTEYQTQTGSKQTINSDYLILTIPYTTQRSIVKSRTFVPKQDMAVRDVRYVEVTKILLQHKTRWWEKVFAENHQGLDGSLISDLPIRYIMFPKTTANSQTTLSNRGVIMAAHTFEQDATILSALTLDHRIYLAAQNIDRIFPHAKSLDQLEVGASQCFPADELAGGSAFCYLGPTQKSEYLETMCESDWEGRVLFAGEQASFTHGWIQGALEAGLRCVGQVAEAARHRVV